MTRYALRGYFLTSYEVLIFLVQVSTSPTYPQQLQLLTPSYPLDRIRRPYLGSLSKCALQRTCRQMRGLLSDTRAWRSLDLRAEVIGTRTMRSGRQSHLSHQPLFFLARSVVVQVQRNLNISRGGVFRFWSAVYRCTSLRHKLPFL